MAGGQVGVQRVDVVAVDPEAAELWAPCFGRDDVDPLDADLTAGHRGQPIGERVVVAGRVVDEAGRPASSTTRPATTSTRWTPT
ncbi:hypothetical protein JHV675_54810 [Mycobacterium avium subsp. hominissuis]